MISEIEFYSEKKFVRGIKIQSSDGIEQYGTISKPKTLFGKPLVVKQHQFRDSDGYICLVIVTESDKGGIAAITVRTCYGTCKEVVRPPQAKAASSRYFKAPAGYGIVGFDTEVNNHGMLRILAIRVKPAPEVVPLQELQFDSDGYEAFEKYDHCFGLNDKEQIYRNSYKIIGTKAGNHLKRVIYYTEYGRIYGMHFFSAFNKEGKMFGRRTRNVHQFEAPEGEMISTYHLFLNGKDFIYFITCKLPGLLLKPSPTTIRCSFIAPDINKLLLDEDKFSSDTNILFFCADGIEIQRTNFGKLKNLEVLRGKCHDPIRIERMNLFGSAMTYTLKKISLSSFFFRHERTLIYLKKCVHLREVEFKEKNMSKKVAEFFARLILMFSHLWIKLSTPSIEEVWPKFNQMFPLHVANQNIDVNVFTFPEFHSMANTLFWVRSFLRSNITDYTLMQQTFNILRGVPVASVRNYLTSTLLQFN